MQAVDAQGMHGFLTRLGRCYRYNGVVNIAGGSALLVGGAKSQTMDIDLSYDVPSEHHSEFIACLNQVSRETQFEVEQSWPGEFIPLPSGYQDRRKFVGRFGMLDVFLFDFYSVALSKLQRGYDRDFVDVVSMIRRGAIERDRLEHYYQEVLPLLESFRPGLRRLAFEQKFHTFLELLSSQED